MKRISPSLWPNILTLFNLTLGMSAIMFVVFPEYTADRMFIPSFLVAVGALLDRFDGQLARRLNAESELGKQLDSLADLVSFGVAPPLIAWRLTLHELKAGGLILVLIFVLCGAYRLARYNVTEFDGVYMGMPITMAGAFVILLNLLGSYLAAKDKLTIVFAFVLGGLMLILSYLMICKISLKKR